MARTINQLTPKERTRLTRAIRTWHRSAGKYKANIAAYRASEDRAEEMNTAMKSQFEALYDTEKKAEAVCEDESKTIDERAAAYRSMLIAMNKREALSDSQCWPQNFPQNIERPALNRFTNVIRELGLAD